LRQLANNRNDPMATSLFIVILAFHCDKTYIYFHMSNKVKYKNLRTLLYDNWSWRELWSTTHDLHEQMYTLIQIYIFQSFPNSDTFQSWIFTKNPLLWLLATLTWQLEIRFFSVPNFFNKWENFKNFIYQKLPFFLISSLNWNFIHFFGLSYYFKS